MARLTAFLLFFAASARANMYDATYPSLVAGGKCAAHGCATWGNLAADGNTRIQADVNAKFAAGVAPNTTACALPANDPSDTFWCYCAKLGNDDWDYCTSNATTPYPEQINLQHTGTDGIVVAAFVTFHETRPPPRGCTFGAAQKGYVPGYPPSTGRFRVTTLAAAEAACAKADDCNAVTEHSSGVYELRAGTATLPSPDGETSWLLTNAAACRPDFAPPQARWGTSAAAAEAAAPVAGVTRVYVEPGGAHRRYYMHFVKLAGLRPRTTYHYAVRSGASAWSETLAFTSLYYGGADAGGTTKVAIFGDMGVYAWNNMGNLIDDIARGAVDAVVHLGDHAYNLAEGDGARGDGYLNALQGVVGRVPWVPVLGNHEEYNGDYAHRYVAMTWGEVAGNPEASLHPVNGSAARAAHNQATPLNSLLTFGSVLGPATHGARHGPASGTSRYYSVDIGLIHFVALDVNVYYFSNEAQYRAPQLAWLARDLAAAVANRGDVPWIVLMSHYPMYCSSDTLSGPLHDDGQGDGPAGDFKGCWSYAGRIAEVRGDLEPLMTRYGVDAYFAGHEHDYEPVIKRLFLQNIFFFRSNAPQCAQLWPGWILIPAQLLCGSLTGRPGPSSTTPCSRSRSTTPRRPCTS